MDLRGELIINQTEKTELKAYLLGRLGEKDEERVENRLLSDPEFVEEFDITVNELTDEYVAGEVQGAEREQMERYFFAAPARRQKLRVAQALKESQQQRHPKQRWFPRQEWRIAASILLLVGVSFGVWRIATNRGGSSELDQGLLALQTAVREERPIEARISGLPHAAYLGKRGSEAESAMQSELRRAELHLNQAAQEKPEVQHASGKIYLAQGKFDAAIERFEASLKGQPNNAQVYNDLGVAFLEKGELNRSLESFNKALQLDSNLLDALFNRALCYQALSRTEDAKADWREYLKRDAASPWTAEARRKLEIL